jgi:pantetheine-phosphate adenylyltransferase
MSSALFPGSFDPFTVGHEALVRRGLTIADRLIIAVGVNISKGFSNSDSIAQNSAIGTQLVQSRVEAIRNIFADEPRVEVDSYTCLTADYAKEKGVSFILRGVRSLADYENEKMMADINHKLSGIETVFLFAEPEYEHISSSLVRELLHYKKDISHFIPKSK